jgi:hypothetical protein
MKTQQQAEREEQQRIKSLVLNYDLRDGEDQDGDSALQPIEPNYNIHKRNTDHDKLSTGGAFHRLDKAANNRTGQRARKLQLSDVDWYDKRFLIRGHPQGFTRRPRPHPGPRTPSGDLVSSSLAQSRRPIQCPTKPDGSPGVGDEN